MEHRRSAYRMLTKYLNCVVRPSLAVGQYMPCRRDKLRPDLLADEAFPLCQSDLTSTSDQRIRLHKAAHIVGRGAHPSWETYNTVRSPRRPGAPALWAQAVGTRSGGRPHAAPPPPNIDRITPSCMPVPAPTFRASPAPSLNRISTLHTAACGCAAVSRHVVFYFLAFTASAARVSARDRRCTVAARVSDVVPTLSPP